MTRGELLTLDSLLLGAARAPAMVRTLHPSPNNSFQPTLLPPASISGTAPSAAGGKNAADSGRWAPPTGRREASSCVEWAVRSRDNLIGRRLSWSSSLVA